MTAICPRDSLDTDSAEVLRKLEIALGVDSKFQATTDIVEWLLVALPELYEFGLPTPPLLDVYLAALKERKEQATTDEWKRIQPSRRGGNPVGGQFDQFPIPALLLQPPADQIDSQAKGLKYLFLHAVLAGRKANAATAKRLRVAMDPGKAEFQLLGALPEYRRGPDYLGELCQALMDLESTETSLSPNASDLLRRVHRLVPHSAGPMPPQQGTGSKYTRRRSPHPSGVRKGQLPLGGAVETRLTGDPPPVGEAPHDVMLFSADTTHEDSMDSDNTPETVTESEVDAAARQSSRWIERYEKLVPGDYGRFDRVERVRLANVLQDHCAESERGIRLSAGVLALSYLTGHRPDEVLSMPYGADGTLTPDGTYVRRLARPANAYRPPLHLDPLVLSQAESVELALPKFVARWLNREIVSTRPDTLLECLATKEDDVTSNVDRLLEHLRADGRYRRIRVERIAAALALELTLIRQDPALTNLLAGTAAQAPPVLAYYVAYPIEYLQRAFEEAVTRMLGETCNNW